MKFEQAVYRNGEKSKIIQLRDIILEKDFETITEHLYCPYEGCGARLVYNRRTNGNNYLSKLISASHIDGCEYENGTVPNKTVTFFLDENGRLSNKGISRRKADAMNALDDLFDPPVVRPSKPTKPRARPQKSPDITNGKEKKEEKIVRRIKYDPSAPIITVGSEDTVRVYEPQFFQRNLHQISNKDSYKNLKTSALIEKITINEKENYAEIMGSLNDRKVVFVLPPDFFTDTRRGITTSQLMEYLEILKEYIFLKKERLYITVLCQSHKINTSKLVLFIYEPDFMSFQFIRGKRFKTLTDIIAAISTGAI